MDSAISFSPDRPVWIVGGGPSLKGFNFSYLRDLDVVAINKSFMDLPFAKIVWWTDAKFYLMCLNNKWPLMKHLGVKCAGTDHRDDVKYPKEVRQFKFDGSSGLSFAEGYLRHGNNSGYAAINLVIAYGARRIRLLGYDMKLSESGDDHYHDGYPGFSKTKQRTYTEKMLPYFDKMLPDLKRCGAEVINCNPDSALNTFPKRDFWEVFNADFK